MKRISILTIAASAVAAILAPSPAYAGVSGAQAGCHSASGQASSYVTLVTVSADGVLLGSYAHDPVAPFAWSVGYELIGDHTVTVAYRSAGNDWDRANGTVDHGGPGSNVAATVQVSCPAPGSTTVAATTTPVPDPTVTIIVVDPEPAPETTVVLPPPPAPRRDTPTTTTVVARTTTTMPVPSTDTPDPTIAPTSTVSQPPPTVCQEDEPCWDCTSMGNQVCGPEVSDTVAPSTVPQPSGPLANTGLEVWALLPWALTALVVGWALVVLRTRGTRR